MEDHEIQLLKKAFLLSKSQKNFSLVYQHPHIYSTELDIMYISQY